VIVALGTNDLGASPRTVASWLRAARQIVGARRLIWVNLCLNATAEPRLSGYRSINASLARFAPRYGVQLANWCGFATSHGISPGPDGIHYYPSAYRQRARFYAASLASA
jgi:lysophospholipase L1-like esterase